MTVSELIKILESVENKEDTNVFILNSKDVVHRINKISQEKNLKLNVQIEEVASVRVEPKILYDAKDRELTRRETLLGEDKRSACLEDE